MGRNITGLPFCLHECMDSRKFRCSNSISFSVYRDFDQSHRYRDANAQVAGISGIVMQNRVQTVRNIAFSSRTLHQGPCKWGL